jgi:RHS repeat-associated protein
MQFSTKLYDEGTGLSYYGYRFYAPAIGRWMTRDPIGERDGINLYTFVRNNPINYIDPLTATVWSLGINSSAFISKSPSPYSNKGYAAQCEVGIAYDTNTNEFKFYKKTGKSCPTDIVKGIGLGLGPTIGTLEGSFDDFFGESFEKANYNPFYSITETETPSGAYGTSSGSGKGFGVGYTNYTTYTVPLFGK